MIISIELEAETLDIALDDQLTAAMEDFCAREGVSPAEFCRQVELERRRQAFTAAVAQRLGGYFRAAADESRPRGMAEGDADRSSFEAGLRAVAAPVDAARKKLH